jgi:hypothetical protein
LPYTLDSCGINLTYPPNWTLKVKQGRFDVSAEGELKLIDSKGPPPFFVVLSCDPIDGPQNLTVLGGYVQVVVGTTLGPDIIVAENTHIVPKLIGGEDAAAFAITTKYSDPASRNRGAEGYVVTHGGKLYIFAYFDWSDHFDSPESKLIRNQILQSIKFIN